MKNFAFVIPTKDRPPDIDRILGSISAQSMLPKQIVIVDGGTLSLESVIKKYPALPIEHIKSKSSITEARNIGIRAVSPEIEYIAFLDDDIVFEPGSLEAMERFWSAAGEDVGGAGFNIVNCIIRGRINFLKWPFLLDHYKNGVVLKSGYFSFYCPSEQTQPVSWLYGGATMWRRNVLEEYKYDEWYEGYAFMEDIDFSYNVSKKYMLFVAADARIQHLHGQGNRIHHSEFGKMQIINRYKFVKKNPELSMPLFFYASTGQVFENFMRFVFFNREKKYFFRSIGNIKGLVNIIFNKVKC